MTCVNDINFDRRADAESTLKHMREIIDDYGYATVSDYCDLVGGPSEYIDSQFGWYSLDGAKICDDATGFYYEIHFPEPVDLHIAESLEKEEEDSNMYESKDAMVSHPSHYQSESGLEVIDVIEAFTSDLMGIEATDTGNVLKYMCRWKKKNGLQDLEKAKWYLQHLIDHIEKGEN